MCKCSLIVPVMRHKFQTVYNNTEYPSLELSNEFKMNDKGEFNFYSNIKDLPYDQFTDVYIVYLKELEPYIKNSINTYDFVKGNLHFLPINDITKSEPETIVYAITFCGIKGPIFIKDSDHYFNYSDELTGNGVVVYSLEDMQEPIVPKYYSYVNIDDNMQITNVIEKRIISNMFNCGGYLFEDAEQFVKAYISMPEDKSDEKLYISHIIYYLMLNDNIKFKGFKANLYIE